MFNRTLQKRVLCKAKRTQPAVEQATVPSTPAPVPAVVAKADEGTGPLPDKSAKKDKSDEIDIAGANISNSAVTAAAAV